MKYTTEQAKEIGDKLKVDWNKISLDQFTKGLNVEVEHKDVTDGDPIETAKIALAHIKEVPDYYDKLKTVENAKQMPRTYFCKHIHHGIARYNKEMLLVKDDTLKAMNPSFAAKPVYVLHQYTDLPNLQEKADGYVSRSFYNIADGWHWAEFIAVSDKAHQAIANGWRVSNCYDIVQDAQGGTCYKVDYTREVVVAQYDHLAIVPNPRYEEAIIMTPEQFKEYNKIKEAELKQLQNSKNGGIMFFKRKKEEVTDPNEILNAVTEVDGVEVSVADMIEHMKVANAAKKNEEESEEAKKKKEEDEMENAEVTVGDEKMTVKELKEKYKANMAKKNEEDKDKEDEDEGEDEGEDEKKKNALEQENFEKIKNASTNDKEDTYQIIDTIVNQKQRGKDRYGSN